MAMLNFHKDHRTLVTTAITGFLLLSIFIAVIPAYQMQETRPEPDQPALTEEEMAGLRIYISEGCVACHTQQVRNIEMDKVWGSRPSVASDYYYSKQRLDLWRQSPSLLGSERTGPDLTNVGMRQPAKAWHLLHLYDPRIVMSESIMPAYNWLFEVKDSSEISDESVVVPVPDEFFHRPGKVIVAKKEVLELVSYLISLKQPSLSDQNVQFIPSEKSDGKQVANDVSKNSKPQLDGEKLYVTTCAPCHQPNGKGLTGAFPPLAGSPIVNDKDPQMMIKIILEGYNSRPGFAQMPGFYSQLSNEQISAIMNHERSSWGNNAPSVTAEEVKKIREMVDQDKNQ